MIVGYNKKGDPKAAFICTYNPYSLIHISYSLFPISIQVLGNCFGTSLAIDAGADDATGIACTFTTWEEATKTDVLECVGITDYADRTARTCFHTDDSSLVG